MNSNNHFSSNTSYKISLDCQGKITTDDPETRDWLELTERFDHKSSDYAIFKATLEKKHRIVAKIAFTAYNQEYEIAKRLENELRLPTILNYICKFTCLDDRKSLNYSKRNLCKKTGETIYVVLMPYVEGGQIDAWKWTRDSFDKLKNVMKHLIYTLAYASHHIGFLHNDMHIGNVLIKRTQRKEISYGDLGTLKLDGLLPVIMDYDKAYFSKENTWLVYKDLSRIFSLFSTELPLILDTSAIQDILYMLLSKQIEPTAEVCKELCRAVDLITIRYAKSELPPMPEWLRATKA